jgi:hypothetical protein
MMSGIEFELDLFSVPSDRERSQKVLLILMDALANVNMTWLKTYPDTPALYNAPVKYHFDPDEPDPWQDISSTLKKGWGDCEDLACWRIAELRAKGIEAHPYIRWRRNAEGKYTYHALVLWPDGRVEDPSVAMGMRGEMLRAPCWLSDVSPGLGMRTEVAGDE